MEYDHAATNAEAKQVLAVADLTAVKRKFVKAVNKVANY
jgi:hypothetical protein